MSIESTAQAVSGILLKKPLLTTGVALALVVVSTVMLTKHNSAKQGEHYVVPAPQALSQNVLFSGSVAPQSRITLAFERAGRIDSLPYDVGDVVVTHATVATLDARSAYATRERESAILASEQASLDELVNGNRKESIAITQAQLQQKESAVLESEHNLAVALINAFTVASTAMERTTDVLFDDTTSATPTIKYSTPQRSLEIALENERLQLGSVLSSWRADVTTLREWQNSVADQGFAKRLLSAVVTAVPTKVPRPDFAQLAQKARGNIVRLAFFFEDLSKYAGELSLTSGLTQTQIDAFVASIATERSALQTALATLTTKREAYASAQASLLVTQEELALAQAPSRAESIAVARARIRAQESAIQSADVEISKHILRAPQHGVVTQRFVEEGELVSSGTPILTIDSSGSFKIDARVSELDIIFLETGMRAQVTTDALGPDHTFSAYISHIDPSETIENGTAGYGLELTIDDPKTLLRAGMTANVIVPVVLEESAFVVPIGLVERTADGSFVHVLTSGKVQRIPVTLGRESIDGLVSIIDGVTTGTVLVEHDQTTPQ